MSTIMTLRTLSVAAALAAGLVSAQASEIRAGAGASLDLGTLGGVAYYTPEANGYHVVVTIAPRGAAPAMRLEATLAPEQTVKLSTPRMADEPATAVEITRSGDRIFVSKAGASEWQREANASH